MRAGFFFASLFMFNHSIAQYISKPILDTDALKCWPSVSGGKISNDGRYLIYFETITTNQQQLRSDLIIQSSEGNWKIKIPDQRNNVNFSADSKLVFFLNAGDSLSILKFPKGEIQYIPEINNYELAENNEKHFLVCHSKKSDTESRLINLSSRKETSINIRGNYSFNDSLTNIFWFINDTLHRFNTETGEEKCFSPGNQASELFKEYPITELQSVKNDGKDIFILLQKAEFRKKKPATGVSVDVWSYTDATLQSQQLYNGHLSSSFLAVIHLPDYSVQLLQHDSEEVWNNNGKWIIISKDIEPDALIFERNEWYWNRTCSKKYFIRSACDGSEKFILQSACYVDFKFSPDGNFLVFFNSENGKYESYELATGMVNHISSRIPLSLKRPDYDYPTHHVKDDKYLPPLGFVKNRWLLLSDWRDIWQIDLKSKHSPVNITHGYGRRNNICFYLAYDYQQCGFDSGSKIILKAFSKNTKENGFYSAKLNQSITPVKLTMGPYIFGSSWQEAPHKAANAEVYLTLRMNEMESPNYFITKDFKKFTQLTDVHPEKKYNWLKAELVEWKLPDGSCTQGVLYKPENFDSSRKYPTVFYCYEKLSDELHQFKRPRLAQGPINISWMVSHGYLVFTPDIHYSAGQTGKNACNTVASAAQYLSKRKYVDAMHMGLQGHSFGGYETNYIITHTHLFAAACSASGLSDLTHDYNSVSGWGASKQLIIQMGQARMGSTPWRHPGVYIENSPIYYVNKVTTPVLLMHNRHDEKVDFSQGLGFFIALRSLGKKAWLLQYDNETHILDDLNNLTDYTVRVTQFFDHYLKGAPAPRWMLDGIPAYLKGIESRLELDSSGRAPGPGLLKASLKHKVSPV